MNFNDMKNLQNARLIQTKVQIRLICSYLSLMQTMNISPETVLNKPTNFCRKIYNANIYMVHARQLLHLEYLHCNYIIWYMYMYVKFILKCHFKKSKCQNNNIILTYYILISWYLTALRFVLRLLLNFLFKIR